MNADSSRSSPAVFTLVGLAPPLAPYALLVFGALLSFSIALAEPAPGAGAAELAGLAAGLILWPLTVMIGLYSMTRSQPRWILKGVYLYVALDLLLLGLVFAVLLGLGGASMAAVEDVVNRRAVAQAAAQEALIWLLLGQALIIPWAAGVTFLTKRLSRDREA